MSGETPVNAPADLDGGPLDSEVERLLGSVEALPAAERMATLAAHARSAADTPEFEALLTELATGDSYRRRIALHLAMAARDLPFVERTLAGGDVGLRRAALRAVRTLPVSDDACAAVLDTDAPTSLRLACYRMLRHARRTALADRLLPAVVAERGHREAAVLLAACSDPVVRQWLPKLASAVSSWSALAKRHPAAVLDSAEQDLACNEAGQGADWGWWQRRGSAIGLVAMTEPRRTLAFLERHTTVFQARWLSGPALGALLDAEPERTVRLFADQMPDWRWQGSPLEAAVFRRLRTLPDPQVVTVARRCPHRLSTVLAALPPGRRAVIFEHVTAGWGDEGLRTLPVLGLLPRSLAAAEARRMLDWHAGVWHSARSWLDDPDLPLRLTAHLPYAEAVGPLTEAATAGDPRRRGLARTLLLDCTARTGDPARLGVLLADLAQRTHNEPDPLRTQVLTALAALRPALLTDEHLPALTHIATSAISARDCSVASRTALLRLAGRILHHHDATTAPGLTALALDVYGALVARFGAAGLSTPEPPQQTVRRRRQLRRTTAAPVCAWRLDLVLRRGQQHDLLAVLRPHLDTARARGDFDLAVTLAEILGRRAWSLAELQDDLGTAVLRAPEPIARRAADRWLADPSIRDDRAAVLVRLDPSTVALDRVGGTVIHRRTDLLAEVLTLTGDGQGRFGAPRTPWLPAITGQHSRRWTPGVAARVHAAARDCVNDPDLPITVRIDAVRCAGRLSQTVPAVLADLAGWARRPETVLAEAAIEALSCADAPTEALTLLLDHARGPCSRVAVAALGRCCARVSPAQLRDDLAQTLFGSDSKVTVRKEAARQLARHRPPDAVDLLLRAWDDGNLHPDVRVAVAVALRHSTDDPRALPALASAATTHTGELLSRTLFQADPLEYAPETRPGYAGLVHQLLLAAAQPGVRFRGCKAFARWAPWYHGGVGHLVSQVGAVDDPNGDNMLEAFLALLRTGTVRDEVVDVLSQLMAVHADGTTAQIVEPAVDPVAVARSRIKGIARELPTQGSVAGDAEAWHAELTRQVIALLASQPLYLPVAVDIAVRLLVACHGRAPRPVSDALCEQVCALAELLQGRPVLAAATAENLVRLIGNHWGAVHFEPGELLTAAQRLASRGDLAAGLLAVSLVKVANWRDIIDQQAEERSAWQQLLLALRHAPQLEVQQEAVEIDLR